MILFTKETLDHYKDSLLEMLKENEVESDSHKWLVESKPKRMIYTVMYGDLLGGRPPQKILDVGGGYTGLTKTLIEKNEYHLLDIDQSIICINQDWYYFTPVKYDIIIANDLFPNTDQRLSLFIEKFIPHCKEMRLSLTYHNQSHFYKTKRTDGEEILFMQAYDGFQVKHILEKYANRIADFNPELLLAKPQSLFANNRLVAYVSLKGDL